MDFHEGPDHVNAPRALEDLERRLDAKTVLLVAGRQIGRIVVDSILAANFIKPPSIGLNKTVPLRWTFGAVVEEHARTPHTTTTNERGFMVSS